MTQVQAIQGDMWDRLSKSEYGTELQMSALTDANKNYADMLTFQTEIPLAVPDLETSIAEQTTPPWEL